MKNWENGGKGMVGGAGRPYQIDKEEDSNVQRDKRNNDKGAKIGGRLNKPLEGYKKQSEKGMKIGEIEGNRVVFG